MEREGGEKERGEGNRLGGRERQSFNSFLLIEVGNN